MTPEQESELRDLTNGLIPNTCGVENPRAWPRLVDHVDQLLAQARADALEEAAKICEQLYDSSGEAHTEYDCAATIRARKDGQ